MHLFLMLEDFTFHYVIILLDMLAELLRREKEAQIIPDADIDAFMKAIILILYLNIKFGSD